MDDELVEVFAGPSVKAGRVRSRLEAEGLTAFLRDETMGLYEPWVVASGSVGAVKVVVPRSEEQRAREVLAEIGA
jgi:hypothetical protein